MVLTSRKREPTVSLERDWQFRIDPEDRGETAGWTDPNEPWTDGRTVSVPHSWQEHDDLREYTGAAWYRRTFEFSGVRDSERAVLSFGAVDHETAVWVNGERAGGNEGGYLPFTIDVTDAVEDGTNTVVLRVYDPEDLSEILHGKQGTPWYTRVSGPWQRVDLLTVPETHVRDIRVTPDLEDDTATFDISVTGGDEVDVTISHDGTAVTETTTAVSENNATATVSIPNPDYWTPDRPTLYDIEVSLRVDGSIVDVQEDYFGMRSISIANGDLLLNGEPLAVRGALDQAYYPDTYYRPSDLETFEHEIRTAKELGFNLLRKHIKPAHPEFVELADRLGILVWEEPANPKRYTDASKQRLREQLQGMIERDYNSPSVVAWSIYNEEWGIGSTDGEAPLWEDTEKQDYLEALYYEVKKWDPTRLMCDNSGWAHVATDLNDYHEYFVAPDRLDAWRDRLDEIVSNPGDNYGDVRTDPADAPLLISEFGTWGLPDVARLLDDDGTEPHWFDHDFLDGMKRPSGVRERFEENHISTVFDSISDLAAAWQERELQSLELFIRDMRERERISGYIITELTDIEWEFNGILDYHRDEKALHDEFARVNAPTTLFLDMDSHVAWGGESVTADVVVVNETNRPLETTVSWDGLGATGETDVTVDPHSVRRLDGAVTVSTPNVDELTTDELTASIADPDRTVTHSVFVAPREAETPDVTVYAENRQLRDAVATRDYETVDDPMDADVSIVTDPSTVPGTALVLPDNSGHLDETDRFEYVDLPERESWNLCACLVYQNMLPAVDAVPGWAFGGIYPYGYVSDMREDDDVSIGYTEGWIENSGAIAAIREGDDPTGVCTLQVTDVYGEHPIATAVVDRLLDRLHASSA